MKPPERIDSTDGPPTRETAVALKLWVVLARAYQALAERARHDLESRGLYGSEFAVLEALFHKGRLTLGEVGRKVLLTSGSITHVVDKLEARGLVARQRCEEDQRVTYAELTEAGRAVVAGVFPDHAAAIRDAAAGLTIEEQREAIELLKRLGRAAAGERDREVGRAER